MAYTRFRTGAHTKHRLQYHLVWVPKYRKSVARSKVATRLRTLFYECAQANDWSIEELEILPDHVHMLVQLPPSTPVSTAVKYLKGGSSKVIRKEFPGLEAWLWGKSLWAKGYYAESVGPVNEAIMRTYIKEQWQRREEKL